MATILPDTAIAAVNANGTITVYSQKTDGTLTEHTYHSSKKEWKVSSNPELAKLFTPLAAASFEVTDTAGNDIIDWRLYFLDKNNYICERYRTNSSGWNIGQLDNLRIEAAHFSKLAIDGPNLYYQETGGHIKSLTRDISNTSSTWTVNSTPLTSIIPLLGTSLAATDTGVVTQGGSGTFGIEHNDSSYSPTTIEAKASPHTSLCVVGNSTYRCTFYTDNKSKLKGRYVNSEADSKELWNIAEALPRSCIAAITDTPSDDDPDVIRLFFQKDKGDQIVEYRYIASSGWNLKNPIT